MQLKTKRLLLRDFRADDWQAVHQYATDPEVIRFMPWGPNTVQESINFINLALAKQEESPRSVFDLAITRDGQLIGSCGLKRQGQQGMLGYVLDRDHWGQGLMTEAAGALLNFGFKRLNLHRIWATCDPENHGSYRVMEKLGMRREGLLKEHLYVHGEWRDSYLYAILEREWVN